jgi:RNA polymerase sigma-70 factor (ECF subfamily)
MNCSHGPGVNQTDSSFVSQAKGRKEARNLKAAAEARVDYDELYREHRERVFRLCRLLLADTDEADDVAQEVFVKMLRSHTTDGRAMDWGPWLAKVAVNACRDRRRSGWWRWWRERGVEFDECEWPHSGATPERELLNREERLRVWRVFRGLSDRQREVFALRYLEGWSTDDVADVLSLSPGSVKRHLFRAVHNLRDALTGAA